ncbi:hypothetical protein NBRC110019_09350 [Neptunitalea chrysea]|uniref:Uncharacterized protein n=1 Tax=Neptunitalea chrysea TaxID=1647581 RepID=A0A9W6B3N3_9FLAO|nr:hypothetical protein [Neptunitalea chrysea]GLB51896.1 hypothetical protein NBRC110019_09350 [Neptunitalea chrysea]
MREKKIKYLILGIVMDGLGMLSYAFPLFGELIDIVWAPISSLVMNKMYKGISGKVASIISLIEEGLPGLDFIPTFTLMWVYTYIIKSEDENTGKLIPIRVRS